MTGVNHVMIRSRDEPTCSIMGGTNISARDVIGPEYMDTNSALSNQIISYQIIFVADEAKMFPNGVPL